MRLTQEMIIAIVREYYEDPCKRGYFGYGNITKDGQLIFYIPQLMSLANEPVIEKTLVCNECGSNNCEHNDYRIVEKIHPSRLSCIFQGIKDAPNSLTSEDVKDAFNFFYTYIRPDDKNLPILKE